VLREELPQAPLRATAALLKDFQKVMQLAQVTEPSRLVGAAVRDSEGSTLEEVVGVQCR